MACWQSDLTGSRRHLLQSDEQLLLLALPISQHKPVVTSRQDEGLFILLIRNFYDVEGNTLVSKLHGVNRFISPICLHQAGQFKPTVGGVKKIRLLTPRH